MGATYYTTDGKVHAFFNNTSNHETEVMFNSDGTGTVDWGDGAPESFSSGYVYHTYSTKGSFHCSIDTSNATWVDFGTSDQSKQAYATKITHVFYPSTIVSFGNTFNHCFNLEAVVIPKGILNIRAGSFLDCVSLKSIVIPNGVNEFGDSVFEDDSCLETISSPCSTTTCGSGFLSGCHALKNITIPNCTVGFRFLYDCHALRKITMAVANTSWPKYFFHYPWSLQSVILPDTLASIAANAFEGANSLQSIIIPASVSEIGAQAFLNCRSLYSVTLLATTPPTLSNANAFDLSYQKKIYVPAESVAAYKAATNWDTFGSIIEAIPS